MRKQRVCSTIDHMLSSTFIHAQGIGEKTERAMWRAGFHTWEDILSAGGRCHLSRRQQALLIPTVEESVAKLKESDYAYFARKLPARDHWRAYDEFGHKVACVDIETSSEDAITMIGVYDGDKVTSYIKGFNLEAFADDIRDFPMIVTFCGSGFDLPHIRRAFPGLDFDQLHIDLCPTLRRIGLTGGLKKIEKALGLERPEEVAGMNGWDAVRLWNEYEWGSEEALRLLKEYNAYDVINLEKLAEYAYKELKEQVYDSMIHEAGCRRI